MNAINILDLLDDYLHCACQVASGLRERWNTNDLLSGVSSGTIPRSGRFFDFGGGSYEFHGSGCRIEALELEIDFDFGPNGTVPGADPWKLFDFAKSHEDAYQWLPLREDFSELIQSLVQQRILQRNGQFPSPHLLQRSTP